MKRLIHGSWALVALLCICSGPALGGEGWGVSGVSVSLRGSYLLSGGDELPYAYDTDDGNRLEKLGLGHGGRGRAAVDLGFENDFALLFRYTGTALKESDSVGLDTGADPCNIAPLQGEYDDCFDQSDSNQTTVWHTLDVTAGKSFDIGGASVLPFLGIRAARFDQNADVAYLYEGGNEAFIDRNIDFSGIGLRVGIAAEAPVCDGFFVAGGAAFSQLFGRRKLTYDTFKTDDGVFDDQFSSKVSRSIHPLSVDGDLKFGYRTELIGQQVDIAVGYEVEYWHSLLDTQNTEGSGAFSDFELGSKVADSVVHGPLLELTLRF